MPHVSTGLRATKHVTQHRVPFNSSPARFGDLPPDVELLYVKTYWGGGGIAQRILNLGIRWR